MARSLTVQHEENLKPSGLFLFFLGAAAVVLSLCGIVADDNAVAAPAAVEQSSAFGPL